MKPRNRVAVTTYPPGEVPTNYNFGDFILTHRHSLFAMCIRFGERFRLNKNKREYAFWNHCAMIADEKGTLIEALWRGISVSKIEKYKNQEITVVRIEGAYEIDRAHAVNFAWWSVGEGYGFLTFFNVTLWALLGGKYSFGIDGQQICSGLVARCLERYGEIFPKDPRNMMPSDLAMFFNVPIPPKG